MIALSIHIFREHLYGFCKELWLVHIIHMLYIRLWRCQFMTCLPTSPCMLILNIRKSTSCMSVHYTLVVYIYIYKWSWMPSNIQKKIHEWNWADCTGRRHSKPVAGHARSHANRITLSSGPHIHTHVLRFEWTQHDGWGRTPVDACSGTRISKTDQQVNLNIECGIPLNFNTD